MQALRLALKRFDRDPFPIALAAIRLGFQPPVSADIEASADKEGMAALGRALSSNQVETAIVELETLWRNSAFTAPDVLQRLILLYAFLQPSYHRWTQSLTDFDRPFLDRMPLSIEKRALEMAVSTGLADRHRQLDWFLRNTVDSRNPPTFIERMFESTNLPWIGLGLWFLSLILPLMLYRILIRRRLIELRSDYGIWKRHQEQQTHEHEANIRSLRQFLDTLDNRELEDKYHPSS